MRNILQHPFTLGAIFFSVELLLILCICPEPTLSASWLSLASHWDSEWYEAIAQFGYINIDGPEHTGLQNANVAFFPGYPYLARVLVLVFGMNAKVALLISSQAAALLFWCLLFKILENVSLRERIYAAILIMIFPTSWYLYMGYSESLFIVACCLMIWLATQKRWILSGLCGVVMTATRIVGIPVLIAPLMSLVIVEFSWFMDSFKTRNTNLMVKKITPNSLILIVGSMGCLGFLIYCAVAFDSWHLYFDMERIGWKSTADPLFLFRLPTWLPPPLGFPADFAPPLPIAGSNLFNVRFFNLAAYTFSETLVPMALWLCILYFILIFRKPARLDRTSLTWYLAALLLFLFTCFSIYTRSYEAMSRYLFPVWILLILSDVTHPDKLLMFRLNAHKWLILLLVMIYAMGGYWLQLLHRFFIGWWVA